MQNIYLSIYILKYGKYDIKKSNEFFMQVNDLIL
jgi:hypothetical protein